jgi:hypothetical protein
MVAVAGRLKPLAFLLLCCPFAFACDERNVDLRADRRPDEDGAADDEALDTLAICAAYCQGQLTCSVDIYWSDEAECEEECISDTAEVFPGDCTVVWLRYLECLGSLDCAGWAQYELSSDRDAVCRAEGNSYSSRHCWDPP